MQGLWESMTDWVSTSWSNFAVARIYMICAISGGTIILGQTGLSLFGMGVEEIDPDMDVDDIEGGDGLNFLSLRALAAFLTFFGLVGWAGVSSGWSAPVHVAAAFAAGSSVMLMVAAILRFFRRMGSDGSQRIENAVGQTATVYLRIPAENSGKGKITVPVQGRTIELQATTPGPELPTGSACRVEKVITQDTVEVVSLQ